MPDFCDGPKAFGASRVVQNTNTNECIDDDIEVCNPWFDFGDFLNTQLVLKDNLNNSLVKSVADTNSTHVDPTKPGKNTILKITECPKGHKTDSNKYMNTKRMKNTKNTTINKNVGISSKTTPKRKSSLKASEKEPSQSSRTITQTFSEDINSL